MNQYWAEFRQFTILGREPFETPLWAGYDPATPDFLSTLRIPVLRGVEILIRNCRSESGWVLRRMARLNSGIR
ncbi:MAG: hypothetical protein ACRD1R_12080 [Acidobacteriota bacterium]